MTGTVTSSMFKAVIVEAIFLTLMGGMEFLFIGSQLSDPSHMSLTQILSESLGVLLQPELIILNSALIIVGLIIGLITARELLPV